VGLEEGEKWEKDVELEFSLYANCALRFTSQVENRFKVADLDGVILNEDLEKIEAIVTKPSEEYFEVTGE